MNDMYRLVLCLRYLRSRIVAYFAVIGMALVVAMMVIVVSVMTGFVDKVERAARGLYGDIILEADSQVGLPLYDEFIAYTFKTAAELKDVDPDKIVDPVQRKRTTKLKHLAKLEAATPYIQVPAMLRIRGQEAYRQPVRVVGIRLPQHVKVTSFGKGLFVQKGMTEPTWDPPVELMKKRVVEDIERAEGLLKSLPESEDVIRDRVSDAIGFERTGLGRLGNRKAAEFNRKAAQKELQRLQEDGAGPDDVAYDNAARTLRWWSAQAYEEPDKRAILGLGIPALAFRLPKGQPVRIWGPGHKIILWVFPLGSIGAMDADSMKPRTLDLSVIDDCSTDVSSVDSNTIYVPFDTLQKFNDMGATRLDSDPSVIDTPARCSQILFKVKPEFSGKEDLYRTRQAVEAAWTLFCAENPDVACMDAVAQTWRQRQASIINTVEAQRMLMIIILCIISVVVVVLILVIFYMIVLQKTHDIGVLKAVGASSWGIAGIFLQYAAAVGVVGSAMGVTMAYFFVRNINPVADWLSDTFNFRVWDREFNIFEKIPNEVQLSTVIVVVIGAIAASMVGALIPAILAARMQPVEALRYE